MKKMNLSFLCIALASLLLTSCTKDVSAPVSSVLSASDAAGTIDQPRPVKGKIKRRVNIAVSGTATLYPYGVTIPVGSDGSDANGDFVIDSIVPGDYTIVVTASGFDPVEINFTIPLVEETEYDLGDIFMD